MPRKPVTIDCDRPIRVFVEPGPQVLPDMEGAGFSLSGASGVDLR